MHMKERVTLKTQGVDVHYARFDLLDCDDHIILSRHLSYPARYTLPYTEKDDEALAEVVRSVLPYGSSRRSLRKPQSPTEESSEAPFDLNSRLL